MRYILAILIDAFTCHSGYVSGDVIDVKKYTVYNSLSMPWRYSEVDTSYLN